MVKNPLCNVGDAGLIPGWTTKPVNHNEDPACCNKDLTQPKDKEIYVKKKNQKVKQYFSGSNRIINWTILRESLKIVGGRGEDSPE